MFPSNSRGTVYINPNFRNTHINPKFLKNNVPNSIHINPAFLEKQQVEHSISTCTINGSPLEDLYPEQFNYIPTSSNITMKELKENTEAKIIPKSRTKLIRGTNKSNALQNKGNLIKEIGTDETLLKIGFRKLIRTSAINNSLIVNNKFSKLNTRDASSNFTNTEMLRLNNLKSQKYKIDRRIVIKPTRFLNGVRKKTFVSQFAFCRTNLKLTPKKVVGVNKKIIQKILPKESNKTSSNIKLELLNINGVLYKSTRTKLQRSTTGGNQSIQNKSTFTSPIKKLNTERILYVRGNKFVLDKSGLKLTKMSSKEMVMKPLSSRNMKRIDIGGLTYVAKSNNVFVRTDIHVTRNYLSTTKQRSINTLYNRLVKTNIPCPIYRKLGKCMAFEKGRCPKLHEKKQIAICPKFLKGECLKQNCLLSHNINFSKMPVCKFYLQGCCVREDCPYLHRKLGKSVEICLEFLKGFCALAEKCPKRHQYLCPDFEKNGKCDKVKCIYCTKRLKEVGLIDKNNENLGRENQTTNETILKKLRLNLVSVVGVNKKIIQKCVGDRNLQPDKVKCDKDDKFDGETSRYFIEKKIASNDIQINSENFSGNVLEISKEKDLCEDKQFETETWKRPKLGVLPAFIPL